MKGEQETRPDPCEEELEAEACGRLALDRIRYFTGRHMTARDFSDADAYHRSFRHLHNRVLHGWGIACGLEVLPHPQPECRPDRVLVRCGLALDCCGREVVVSKDVVPRPLDPESRPDPANGIQHVRLLCLRYREVPTEKVPVLYSADACSTPSRQYGRVREGYELAWHWVRPDDLWEYGWLGEGSCPPEDEKKEEGKAKDPDQDRRAFEELRPDRPIPGPVPPAPPVPEEKKEEKDPCREDDEPGRRPACCLEPDCPKNHCIPLAVVWPDKPDEIDVGGRRTMVHPGVDLTHVCAINWTHGGLMKESEFRSLRVRFDRPLARPVHPNRPGPVGINERTFVVQYGEQLEGYGKEDLDFVDWARPPYLTPDRKTAVYEIRNPRACVNHVIHVTLRCDAIVDCDGNPVDGDHLRGRLPSGNGLAGGTFESWFRIVADGDYDRTLKATDDGIA
jgi:hypothetical protein